MDESQGERQGKKREGVERWGRRGGGDSTQNMISLLPQSILRLLEHALFPNKSSPGGKREPFYCSFWKKKKRVKERERRGEGAATTSKFNQRRIVASIVQAPTRPVFRVPRQSVIRSGARRNLYFSFPLLPPPPFSHTIFLPFFLPHILIPSVPSSKADIHLCLPSLCPHRFPSQN